MRFNAIGISFPAEGSSRVIKVKIVLSLDMQAIDND